jgi:putative tricarboxylic transport membrane protein
MVSFLIHEKSEGEAMKRNDLIGGLFFLGVGLLFTLYSHRVEIGTWDEPGPGFLPFWAGMVVIGMSVLLIGKSLSRGGRTTESFFPQSDSWKRVVFTLLALVGYNFLLKPLGFVLVTFFFVGFLVKFIFPGSWKKAFIAALLSTVSVRLIFVNLLEINFPKGFLGF